MNVSLPEFIPILQMAIGPVILISGVGLLLLSMTTRFGRILDRSRTLAREMRTATPAERERIREEIGILMLRGRLARRAMTLAVWSVLFAALLIIAIFLAALFHLAGGVLVAALFVACMACLIGGLVTFLKDVNLSLAALKLELATIIEPAPPEIRPEEGASHADPSLRR